MSNAKYRIGIDIGGTFTDFTVACPDGTNFLWKQDSTRPDPMVAIGKGLEAVSAELGLGVEALLGQTDLLVHGTTIATNMLIEWDGPVTGLLCTEGMRDTLHFRDGYRPSRFDVHLHHPGAPVDRHLRLSATGRINSAGEVIQPLDEESVVAAAARFREAGVVAVAISFLWSVMNPVHELRAEEILRRELPEAYVVCSHKVLPEMREWERTSATVLSAYVLPRIAEYLASLRSHVDGRGLQAVPQIMQVNGGCARIEDVLERPINIVASGPAAAPAAALHYRDLIGEDLVVVDMGGTSLDVCLIQDGRASMSRTIKVSDQPIGVEAVDVHSVGAGGGSIAWVDDGGALRVGPQSAGATPGPAAYDRGGDQPTVTDANVVLGYLSPDAFLGGRRRLRDDLSRKTIERHVAEPLGIDVIAAAEGIVRIVNDNMVSAIRAVSIERGIDIRGFTLVCAGGAGGLHAVELARQMGISRVAIPREAGVFCSFGMTVTEVRHDYLRARRMITDQVDLGELSSVIGDLEEQARRELSAEGFASEQIETRRYVDARYPGQIHEITVSIAGGEIDRFILAEFEDAFHAEHEKRFGYCRRELPVECLHWRVVGAGGLPLARPESVTGEGGSPAPTDSRELHFGSGPVASPLYESSSLGPDARVEGPAIIASATTTIVLHPGDELRCPRDISAGFIVDVAPKESRLSKTTNGATGEAA